MNLSCFKAYDIRGRLCDELNEDVACRIEDLVVGYMIKDRLGQPVFGTITYHHKRKLQDLRSNETIEFSFDFQANLGHGTYFLAIALHADDMHVGKTMSGVTMLWRST